VFRAKLNKQSDELSGWLHDLCFNADALASLAESSPASVEIPIYCKPLLPPAYRLVIENLSGVEIDDKAGVQWYDINRIVIGDDESEARLIGNIPITVTFKSDDRLQIRLDRGERP